MIETVDLYGIEFEVRGSNLGNGKSKIIDVIRLKIIVFAVPPNAGARHVSKDFNTCVKTFNP